jgi:hypothetical protein
LGWDCAVAFRALIEELVLVSEMSATGVDTLSWSFGLRNAAGNYLTAEVFGNRINCNAGVMKKKQIFFLEQDASTGKVFIRTFVLNI